MKKNKPRKELERYKELLEYLEDNFLKECQVCGGPLILEKVNLEDYQSGKLYLMEKVPAFICQECGEVWVPEPIMLEFEKMIKIAKHKSTKKAKSQNKKQAGGRRK